MIKTNTQLKFGIILQYLQMALNIAINLIYTPFLIRILGNSEYGIYSLVSSIIAYLNLLSLGFGAAYIRFYARYKRDDDEEGIAKLNGLYLIVFFIMGLLALFIGLLFAFNVGIFFNSSYTSKDLYIAKILMIFLAINMFISFPASVFVSYITSQERFIFQKLVNIGKTVISPLFCIVLLINGYGSIGMVMATTIISFVIDIFNILYCIFKLDMKIKFNGFRLSLLKEIAIFSSFIAINQIIDQINWQTDKIILGKMINATAVAIYTVAATINSLYINFSTAISGVFAPRIHKIVNLKIGEEEKNNQLTEIFINVGRMQFFIIVLILTGFVFFGQYFIYRWAGEDYKLSYYISLLLILPVSIPLCQNIGLEIQRAKNKHQFRSIVCLIMAGLNIIVSIILCYYLGIIGTAIGTTISLLVANGLIMNVYYHKKLGINIIKFWKSILSILPALIIPCLFGIFILLYIKYDNLFEFILWIILYALVYFVSVVLLGTNKKEKTYIKSFFRKNK